jgi:hypothetical protein
VMQHDPELMFETHFWVMQLHEPELMSVSIFLSFLVNQCEGHFQVFYNGRLAIIMFITCGF